MHSWRFLHGGFMESLQWRESNRTISLKTVQSRSWENLLWRELDQNQNQITFQMDTSTLRLAMCTSGYKGQLFEVLELIPRDFDFFIIRVAKVWSNLSLESQVIWLKWFELFIHESWLSKGSFWVRGSDNGHKLKGSISPKVCGFYILEPYDGLTKNLIRDLMRRVSVGGY